MPTSSVQVSKVAFLGDYPPRHCGIATFTRDLRDAVAAANPDWNCPVIAVSDQPGTYRYPDDVRFEIPQPDMPSYVRAANFLNLAHVDVLCVQHEFGIFGGTAGSHVLGLLRHARMPVVTTLHTVLEKPDPDQRRVFAELIDMSTRVVVMAERARRMLREIYRYPDEKVALIPHGIPDVAFTDPSFYKDHFNVAGRPVMLTFGLLSPNKGIEHVIQALPEIIQQHPRLIYIVLGATHPNLLRDGGENYRLQLERLARSLGVDRNVLFVNRYVSNGELCEYIGAADIYITPYLNEAQITSGTLSYCYGAGKAIVSTPYWHAVELLGEGRGVMVPFRDPGAIAHEVSALLSDEARLNALRKQAYLAGRHMVWGQVANEYTLVFQGACADLEANQGRRPDAVVHFGDHSHLPPWRFDHLLRMTDATGLLQHARYTVPCFEHGYCTDDNARALLFSVLLEELDEAPAEVRALRPVYAAFLQHAFVGDHARFRNFMSFDRRWLEDSGSEDSHGRALWALGAVVGRTRSENLRAWAAPLFESALPAVYSFTSPRAWAFAILGLHEYLRSFEGDLMAARAHEELSARLFGLWDAVAAPEWPWFEDIVGYDNARLSHALILTGRWTGNERMRDTGLNSLRWLMDSQRGERGCFRPVGSNGFWNRGGIPAEYDQQPIEPAAAVSACIEAFNTTGDSHWRGEAQRAFDWFLGANDLNEGLYDFSTGGCRDGLHTNRINRNEGAESTLCFLLARARTRQASNAEDERARIRATLDSLLDPHILLRAIRDSRGKIIDFVVGDANEAACSYNRLPREGFVGHRLLDILPAHVATGLFDLYCRAIESGRALVLDDYLYPHDILEEPRYYDIRGVKVGDALSFTWRDVTERHHAAKDLEHRARTDELTKLLNRRGIFEQLEDLRGKTPRTGSDIAVLFVDFDKFKDINDTYGHAAGDEVLRVTAEKLRACLRHSDDLGARVGGDEMLVVLHGVHGMKDAAAIAEKLRRSAAAPVRFDGTSIEATVSVGVALARAEESTDALVSRADAAMYEAKQRGRNQVITIKGQNASGDPLEAIEVTLAIGRVLRLTLVDPHQRDAAIASIMDGTWDAKLFRTAVLE